MSLPALPKEAHAQRPQHLLRPLGIVLLLAAALLPVQPVAAQSVPPNGDATGPAVLLTATQPGMQRLGGAALAAAGLNLATLDPALLHLRRDGIELPLEVLGADDGRLDGADELRFYLPTVGNRWNRQDTLWLTVASTPGQRLARRALPAALETPPCGNAVEQGVWRDNRLYESRLPGADGDHFFAADLRSGPEIDSATLTTAFTPTLPLADGTMTLTLQGASYVGDAHRLQAEAGSGATTLAWNGSGDWQQTVLLPAAKAATLLPLAGAAPSGLLFDQIGWELPVVLMLDARGATFTLPSGPCRYLPSGAAAEQPLYEVSELLAPLRLLPGAGGFLLGGGQYLSGGSSTLHTVQARAYQPADLAAALLADVLYIGPAIFHGPLAPLIAYRQAAGHTVALVDVQALYDGWSYGQVAPEAIRSFLQAVAARRGKPPLAVTLVGDGTSDPLDYTGRGNTTFVPPYLADVDPWLGETACETCFGQLDGLSPLTNAMPEVAVGRLPVKSAAELTALVAKILGYETAPPTGAWRAHSLFVADNGFEADGTADAAGDFGAQADAAAALQLPGMLIDRVYYDPRGRTAPWREPDPAAAYRATHAALDAGAGLLTYVGHSHHWKWAVTDPASEQAALLELYDADTLKNGGRLPVLLAMTCLTSAFQTPAYSGTTLDERLLLNPTGGVVAVWGPTGQGVSYGHDALQRGFYRKLRSAPPTGATLGELTLAGYDELLTHGHCCQDSVRTFALLGDPLTPLRVAAGRQQFLPLLRR